MLNMALTEKGVITSGSHYELTTRPPAVAAVDEQREIAGPTRRMVVDNLGEADDDGGIVL